MEDRAHGESRSPLAAGELRPRASAGAQGKKTAEPRAAGRLVVAGAPGEGKATTGTVYELDSAAVTMGRGPGNDIALEDDFASAFHARLEARPDGVWVEDVGSTNGTAVNGIRLTAPRKLAAGDIVRVGETDFRFER